MPQFGEFVYGGGLYGEEAEGYRVYVKRGAAPVPGVDAPLVATTDLVSTYAVSIASMALVTNASYFGVVTAFNAFGESEVIAAFTFRTDESAEPLLVPSPIRSLRAIALPAGVIQLEWDYSEVNGIGTMADDFFVVGSTSPLPVILPGEFGVWEIQEIVPHVQPRQRYALRVQTDPAPFNVESPMYFRVLSRRDGKFEPYVSDVVVLADAAAPAAVGVEMMAS